MPNVQHIFKQAGPPTNPPTGEGHHWVDTLNNNTYLSKGISTVADWQLIGSGGLPNGGGIGQILIKQSVIDGDASWQNIPGVTGAVNTLPYYNASGDLDQLPGWGADPVTFAVSGTLYVDIANSGGYTSLQNMYAEFNPSVNSPNDTGALFNNSVVIDNASAGFSFGTNGNALNMHANNISHQGTGDVGGINLITNNFQIGNGTDPISVGGIGYCFGFGQVAANVSITGQIQGYGFQVSVNAAASIAQNINAFYDFANIGCSVGGYSSFVSSPNVAEIANNTNASLVSIGGNIPLFTGNAGFTGIAMYPTLGTFGTNGAQLISMSPTITSVNYMIGMSLGGTTGTISSYFHGIDINPTITTIPNGGATGLYINMSNIGGTGHKAIDVVGDVNIAGNLTFSGALSIGQLNAYATQPIVNGGGVPTSIHGLVSSPTIAASTTVALGDTIGLNTAMLLIMGDNSVVTTGFVGLSALALPAVVQMGTGSTVDQVAGATFALSLDGGATGGTIANLDLCRSVAIPNGITTVTRCTGYKFDLPFGDPGTTTWGFYASPTSHNYFAGDLLIGGTAGSDDTVTNSSVALEIKSTTKAFVVSRMTSAQEGALTAINGAVIYNTDTNKFRGYAGGTWIDLH